MSRARNLAGFSSASTNAENPVNIRVGYVTAIAYYGDASGLTGISGGLGTALSDNLSSPLNKIYYTNANLSIASTIIVDPPQSASAAYTQYTDIVMQGGADLIVGDGDTFIPDILGIGTFVDEPGVLSNGNGKVRADNYTDKLGSGAAYGPYGFVTPVGVAITVGSGTSISSPATNTLALGTNNVERLRITSSGVLNVPAGIGPQIRFENQHSVTTDAAISTFDDANGVLVCVGSNYFFNSSGSETRYNTSEESCAVVLNRTGDISLKTGGTSATATTKLGIGTDGNISISDGNLVVASGHGIDFSATSDGSGTATSELLDDYEEGTWTPASVDGTIGNAVGKYVKVGRTCTVWCYTAAYSDNTTSNVIEVGGVPFAAQSSDAAIGTAMIRYVNNTNGSTTLYSPVGYLDTASLRLRVYQQSAQGDQNYQTIEHEDILNTNTSIRWTLTYQTAS